MNQLKSYFAIYLFLLPTLIFAQSSGQSKPIIQFIDGNVHIQNPHSKGWIKSSVNDTVDAGHQIMASEASKAEIKLTDRQLMRIGPLTTARTDSIAPAKITLVQGNFWFDIDAQIVPTMPSLKISIDHGVLNSIPDSTSPKNVYRMTIGKDGTSEIKVYEGRLNLNFIPVSIAAESTDTAIVSDSLKETAKNQTPARNWTAVLTNMQRLIANSNGVIVIKDEFNPNDIDEKSDWVSWNKSRDNLIK